MLWRKKKRHYQICKTSNNMPPMQSFSRNCLKMCSIKKRRVLKDIGRYRVQERRSHIGKTYSCRMWKEIPDDSCAPGLKGAPGLGWCHMIQEPGTLKMVIRNTSTTTELSFNTEGKFLFVFGFSWLWANDFSHLLSLLPEFI